MSIIMNLFYKGENKNAVRFAEEMESSGIADRIRHVEGNEGYDYFYSMKDPETVLLIDAWKDQAALDRHHASELMNEIMKLREKYDLHMEAKRYIPDDQGITEADKKFVR